MPPISLPIDSAELHRLPSVLMFGIDLIEAKVIEGRHLPRHSPASAQILLHNVLIWEDELLRPSTLIYFVLGARDEHKRIRAVLAFDYEFDKSRELRLIIMRHPLNCCNVDFAGLALISVLECDIGANVKTVPLELGGDLLFHQVAGLFDGSYNFV